jgi:CRISPR-associated protein Csb2
MTRFLLLSVRFLGDRYHGLTDNGEKAEWPPSPFRLFQALVAGNARGRVLPDELQNALRWIESLPPPVITAPEAKPGRTLLTYVLNNVSDSYLNSRAPKILRPMLLNGDRLLQYAWTFDETATGATDYAQEIVRAARHIRCLGWGIDLSIGCGEVVETLPAVNAPRQQYRPSPAVSSGGVELRTPRLGSLRSLQQSYADFLRRYESPGVVRLESPALYDVQQYVTGPARPFAVFRLINADGDPVSVRPQLIAPLVGLIRDAAQRPQVVATIGREIIDREVLGHPKESSPGRVSILPLPTIRKEGPADGRIRRVLFAQPLGAEGDLCRRLSRILDGEMLTPLKGEERFPNRIYLEWIDRPKADSVLPCYTGVSRVWVSVTPVLLPGYDDRKQHDTERLMCKALCHAGIDGRARIELSRVPWVPGSLHALAYQPREKLAHYPRWHVRLTFEQPWTGPLALGAGRHAGFGLMAAGD